MKLCMHKGPCGGARYYCLFCITPSYSSVFLIHWVPTVLLQYYFALYCTVCSFPTVTSFLQLIFFTLIGRAVVSQLWQIAVPTARSQQVLYLCLGSDTLSVPWGFLMKLLHNHSLCKHVQTQAEVLFLENVLDLSQPTSASKPAASFIVFGGCSHILLISTCFVFLFFQLLTLTGFAQGWLAWCVTIGLAIVGHDFNRNEVVAV